VAHGSSTRCSAEGRDDSEATESEVEAVGPTSGERKKAAGPSNRGEGQHRENKNGPWPTNCPKKITSSKLGAFLFEKFPGWDFDGKLFGANLRTDMFTKSLREEIDFENAVFANCSSHCANDDFAKKFSDGNGEFEIVNFQFLNGASVADVAGTSSDHGEGQRSVDIRSNRGGGRRKRGDGEAEESICFFAKLIAKFTCPRCSSSIPTVGLAAVANDVETPHRVRTRN
jgi:hypothetical protein